MQKEEWRDIPNTNGRYQASNLGRIRSRANFHGGVLDHWKILKQTENNNGYLYVTIYKKTLVHRIIGEVFLPMIDGKNEINHKDGNPKNNKVSNIEWCDRRENNRHKNRVLGHPGTEKRRIPVQCVETGEVFESQTAAILAGGACDWTHLRTALLDSKRTCYGRHWRYYYGN